jgi:hypothetical protein
MARHFHNATMNANKNRKREKLLAANKTRRNEFLAPADE